LIFTKDPTAGPRILPPPLSQDAYLSGRGFAEGVDLFLLWVKVADDDALLVHLQVREAIDRAFSI